MEDIIEKYGITDPLRLYSAVTTFDELIQANVAFLEGKVEETPYHYGPIDPETVPLVGKLVALNKKGFLSTNGQPALIEMGVMPDTCNKNRKDCGNVWYIDQQKSYIDGYVKLEKVASLIQYLLSRSDIYFVVYGPDGMIGNTFPEESYCVTRSKLSKDESKMNSTKWKEYTHINTKYLGFDEWRGLPNIKRIIKDTRLFSIAGKEYGKGSVEDVLLDFYASRTKGGVRRMRRRTLKKRH